MTDIVLLAHGGGSGGSSLASWTPLWALAAGYAAIVVVFAVRGRAPAGTPLWLRIVVRAAAGLERLTKIPGWAAASAGTTLYGLLVAGIGFYSDVAWHIALGRDEALFTAPHTMIVIGLLMIAASAGIGVAVATVSRAEVGFRLGRLRVPWSMLAMGCLGGAAVSGFPLDEVWHQAYGIDVTMWSPTHMLMILGAALSPLAAWLALGEAGTTPRDGRWARFAHALAAWLTLQGLAASQGEFVFGVPQFQHLFHPVLIMLAGGFALVAIRIIHGRWWALGIAAFTFVFDIGQGPGLDGPVEMRAGGIYVGSALAVELVAWIAGTQARRRFALLAGLGVGTVGLATEWAWNAAGHQPWLTTMLPDALVLGLLAAVGACVLGATFADGVRRVRSPLGAGWLAAAGLAVAFTIAWPMPRTVGNVEGALEVMPTSDGDALVAVTLDPPDAAADARWFQASAWQGGDLHLAEMRRTGPGRYESVEPVPVTGSAKTLIRLHRGNELMALPVWLPADPEIGEHEIPARNRTASFASEGRYLMRETHEGPGFVAPLIYGSLAVAAAMWFGTLWLAVARIARPPAYAISASSRPIVRSSS